MTSRAEYGLGASDVRAIAAMLDIRPTKTLGQNFVIDANTCRRIVRLAGVVESDHVLEVGPGLGSLTLALLSQGAEVTAVEIDPVLAGELPRTIERFAAPVSENLRVVTADALKVTNEHVINPTLLVANLPYNVSVPVLLTMLELFPTIRGGVVMVQAEVADRLVASPGGKEYGIPSLKLAWWARSERVGSVGPSVFWPAPRVDSGLVSFTRVQPPESSATREEVFAVIDQAFAQRRKTLRAALSGWAGSAIRSEEILRKAGVSPQARGEELELDSFIRIAEAGCANTE
ncbi:unannotated protein [freshwater metagenome]|uniref:Unannotated protein n=1 Tax=freshwater metagenome TaxID=449393 RepID=A0A6J7VF86_9ZZZZ